MARIAEVLDLIEPCLDRLYDYVQSQLDAENLKPDDKQLEIMMLQFSALNLEFAELTKGIENKAEYMEVLVRYANVSTKFENLTKDVLAYIGD